EVLDYYEQILDSVDVPLIVQDASGYVGGALSLDTQVLLHRRHGPHRVMFKPEAPPLGQRLTQLLDATDGEARVLEGSGGLALIDAYRRGLIGTMPGPDLVWAVAAIWAALRENDDERAYQIGGALIPLLCPLTSLDSYVVTQKHLLLKQGVFTDARVRGPNSYRIDRHTSEEIDRQYTLLRSTVDSPVSQFAAVRSPI
ncbi:MAG: hypothetical protein ACREFT_05790, partial [Acetobacteraceae bacterium]